MSARISSSGAPRPSLVEALQQPSTSNFGSNFGHMNDSMPGNITFEKVEETYPLILGCRLLTRFCVFVNIDLANRNGLDSSPMLQQFGLGNMRMDVSVKDSTLQMLVKLIFAFQTLTSNDLTFVVLTAQAQLGCLSDGVWSGRVAHVKP